MGYGIHCRKQNIQGNEDMKNYSSGWKVTNETNIPQTSFLSSDSIKKAFSYQSHYETGAGSFFGDIQTYPGGGFVASLGIIISNSFNKFKSGFN